MPDLWESVPIEAYGEKPPYADLIRKAIKKPKKVEEVERGKNAEETSEGIHKSPEVK
jgi:hypothetical protein|tara:strand:+ start:294 stop:464 length:171 start_codon:yes stop_codon:yes gene_type:complete